MEPYNNRLSSQDIYSAKRSVQGKMVAILSLEMEQRALLLILPQSRAARAGEIVELVCTNELEAKPGSEVNRVAYLGFAEIHTGGLILVGDQVTIADKQVGQVIGFDETHAPNHINIVIGSAELGTGEGLGIELGNVAKFALSSKEA